MQEASLCKADPQILRIIKVDKRFWWLTVTNAGSRKIETDDSLVDHAACSFSATAKKAVSVDSAALKPDWLGALEVVPCEIERQLL